MTGLLYISYSRGLSEEDKLIIDKSVFENREILTSNVSMVFIDLVEFSKI